MAENFLVTFLVARCRIRGRPFVELLNSGLTSGPEPTRMAVEAAHPEEEAMPKYMLSVLIDPAVDFASLPKEELEQSGADVDAVNDALAESGKWVFAGGLGWIESGHDCGRARRGAGDHRRPVLRVEGVPRRVLDHRGRRPRRGVGMGPSRVQGLPRTDRGAPLRPSQRLTHVEEVFRAEYGRVVAGLVRRLGDIDLAEGALADALVTALERWPRDGIPPIRQPG